MQYDFHIMILTTQGCVIVNLGQTVKFHSLVIDLTNREFALIEIFMQNAGRLLPRTLICEKVWSSQDEVDANLLDVYMSRLRTKFASTDGTPMFKTVRGVGFKLQ